jgi:hypothetical protein
VAGCTRRTGSRRSSLTGSCSWLCTGTPRGSVQWSRPRHWPA